MVGPALRATYAAPWTLAALAAEAEAEAEAEAGVARTTLAKRFPELVGASPLA